MINSSLSYGTFPAGLDEAVIHLLLKKPTGPAVLANYHLVSNLHFLGKVVERVTAEQLQVSLDDIFIFDPFQSGLAMGHR